MCCFGSFVVSSPNGFLSGVDNYQPQMLSNQQHKDIESGRLSAAMVADDSIDPESVHKILADSIAQAVAEKRWREIHSILVRNKNANIDSTIHNDSKN